VQLFAICCCFFEIGEYNVNLNLNPNQDLNICLHATWFMDFHVLLHAARKLICLLVTKLSPLKGQGGLRKTSASPLTARELVPDIPSSNVSCIATPCPEAGPWPYYDLGQGESYFDLRMLWQIKRIKKRLAVAINRIESNLVELNLVS